MDALYFLIPAALVLSAFGLGLFFWAVHHGQFDDLESPAWRIFLDVCSIYDPDQSFSN